ncbi:MAG: malate transporter, partial [Prochlorococcaceae cyanobacterium]
RLLPALLVKLLVFPLLLLAGVELLGMAEPARSAVVLQAAAPTAVAVLLLSEAAAHESNADGGSDVDGLVIEAAALVLWSTLLALITVPLWAWLLAAG